MMRDILLKILLYPLNNYALRDIRKPMGVSQYEGITTKSLPKRLQQSLPSIQEIEAELSDSPADTPKKRLKKRRVKS